MASGTKQKPRQKAGKDDADKTLKTCELAKKHTAIERKPAFFKQAFFVMLYATKNF